MEDKSFRQGFGCSFLESLHRDFAERPVRSVRITDIETRIRAVHDAHLGELPASTSPDVLHYTATLIGAYLTLRDAGVADARERIERAQAEATAILTVKVKEALDGAPDPFEAMRALSKERENAYFGEAFTFERPRDDSAAYHLEVTSCAFVRVCVAEGVPELGAVLCEFDTAWMRAIEPSRHRLSFARPTTLARDGQRCRFWFSRAAIDPEDA